MQEKIPDSKNATITFIPIKIAFIERHVKTGNNTGTRRKILQ
jgi:hypothetical protein